MTETADWAMERAYALVDANADDIAAALVQARREGMEACMALVKSVPVIVNGEFNDDIQNLVASAIQSLITRESANPTAPGEPR